MGFAVDREIGPHPKTQSMVYSRISAKMIGCIVEIVAKIACTTRVTNSIKVQH